jgi:cytochrome P450
MSQATASIAVAAAFLPAVPHDEFDRLRATGGVHWVDGPTLSRRGRDGDTVTTTSPGYWAVVGHAETVAASKDPGTFSSATMGAFLSDPRTPEQLARTRQLLVNMDAPEHSTTRRLVSAAFGPRAVRALRESVHTNAAEVVARVLASDGFDVVGDLAAELPLIVLADLLGIPRADRSLLLRWSNGLVGFDDPEFGGGDVRVYRDTFAEAFAYALQLAAHRRRHPTDDVVSLLVNSEVDGRRLTDEQFCQFWLLLVIAGNETTRHALSGGLLALAEHPEQRDRLVADPGLLPTATEEVLRWITPIMQFRRTATADTELGGQRIGDGDKVVLYYVAADRDPAVFADPHAFRVDRAPNQHLAFGVGPHFCLGAALARMEISTVLGLLRPHLPRLALTGPARRLESNFMNGIKSLPARFTDRPEAAD